MVCGVNSSTHSLILREMEVVVKLYTPAAVPPGRNFGTLWVGGCVDPRTSLDAS